MATKAHQSAHQSVDADRFARDEESGRRNVAAIADSSGAVITASLTVDGVIETRKQRAVRRDGYAQAA
jgi:hypothetical protein